MATQRKTKLIKVRRYPPGKRLLVWTGTRVHTSLYVTQGQEGAPPRQTCKLQSVKQGRMRFGEHEEEGTTDPGQEGVEGFREEGLLTRVLKV